MSASAIYRFAFEDTVAQAVLPVRVDDLRPNPSPCLHKSPIAAGAALSVSLRAVQIDAGRRRYLEQRVERMVCLGRRQ